MYNEIFDDTGVYAGLRDYIRKFEINGTEFYISNYLEMCELDRLLYHISPFCFRLNLIQ